MSSKILADALESFSIYGKKKAVKTTSFSFRLLTTYSVALLSIFIFTILMNRFYGEAIECFPHDNKYKMAMQLTCWMEGVHHDADLIDTNKINGKDILKQGVGHNHGSKKSVIFKYYQWIVPMLIFQSFIFYLPQSLWNSWEKNTMTKLLGKVSFPVFSDDWKKQRKNLVAYVKDVKPKYHREYALKYLFAELFSLVCLIFNIFMTKWVIQHELGSFWSGYASTVGSFLSGNIAIFNNEASRFFPTLGKCNFNIYGSSGSIKVYDSLCILPQNVIIDKIFVFIYIWYIVAIVYGIINLIYTLLMFMFQILRIYDIGHMLESTVTIRQCKDLSFDGDFGIWFTLKIFRNNLVPIQFQDFCNELSSELKNEGKIHSKTLPEADLEKF